MSEFWKILKLFVLALFVFLIQVSFINSIPGSISSINLILFGLIWFFVFYDFKTSLYFSLSIGLLLDLFSFSFFGVYTLSLIATLILADFISSNLLTNRSIYSFLSLSFFLVLFYRLFSHSLLYFFETKILEGLWFNSLFYFNLALEILWIFLGIIVSFYFLQSRIGHIDSISFDKK
jgi:hypothetical protein